MKLQKKSHALLQLSILLTIVLSNGIVNPAYSASPPTAYQTCLLRHVKSARSELAALHLQKACHRLFSRADALQNRPTNQATRLNIEPEGEDYTLYDRCILKQMSNVQNDQSAKWMIHYCHEQFFPATLPQAQQPTAPPSNLFNLLKKLDGGHNSDSSEHSAPLLDGEQFVPLMPTKGGQ